MFQCGGTKTYVSRTVPGLLIQLSSAGGLFNCFKIILGFLNFTLITPIDTLEFFFAMQELDTEEKDKIKDESRIYKYFQVQLWRSFGFEFKIGDRLARYNRLVADLLSFEYMLTN